MPTEPVLPESELRSLVLRRIEEGRLPVVLSTTIYAGYGQGKPCDLCDQPIACDKIEYDITDPRASKWLRFHFPCHSAWQRECALRLRELLSPSKQTKAPKEQHWLHDRDSHPPRAGNPCK
jgi:hypothetical protein